MFGGSFDPVHLGHLGAAEAVFTQIGLHEVHFIPASTSPFKNKPTVSDKRRLAMLKLAIAPYPYFKIDRQELKRFGTSYTIDTVLQKISDRPQDQLFLMLGMDAWQTFEQWKDWQMIIEHCHIVVMTRPNYAPNTTSEFWQERMVKTPEAMMQASAGKCLLINVPASTAASSQIRAIIQQNAGGDFEQYLPQKVADYIKRNQLYR